MRFYSTITMIAFLCIILTYSTSKYRGVTWVKKSNKWMAGFNVGKKRYYGGCFDEEMEAVKKVSQLCDELGIKQINCQLDTLSKGKKKGKTSEYRGVTWHTRSKKWYVLIQLKGKKKYGGCFNYELDAAKRVNQFCEEFGIAPLNPTISAIPNQQYQKREKMSQYKGVSWNKKNKKWYVLMTPKGQKGKYGGYFNEELDAGKRVNELCEELGIPPQNPTIGAIPNQQYLKKEKTSQYKGVSLHRPSGKWYVIMRLKGGKKYGGCFNDEIEAAKRVNQFCEELGIPLQNPTISAIKNDEQYQKRERISQYKGVSWSKKTGKWHVLIFLKGKKGKYGGYFNEELDAAKRVNQLCEELGIAQLNPTIDMIPNQQYRTIHDYDAIRAEFESMIKILDESNDPTATANLITAINHGEQGIMTEINLRTKNNESALSIAAKYGFLNIVKFLISKGAEKEHFTNDHHTPLSLAVSQNHLKVVQVLFEEWISPNSHEQPYLHLSPIFNVKSREIAQLLIDNDAVTHEIYNHKNQSPLTVACQNGYLDVVEFFLDDGLDLNHLDSDNKTPLFYALTNKHYNVVNLLNLMGAASNNVLPPDPTDKSCEQK